MRKETFKSYIKENFINIPQYARDWMCQVWIYKQAEIERLETIHLKDYNRNLTLNKENKELEMKLYRLENRKRGWF